MNFTCTQKEILDAAETVKKADVINRQTDNIDKMRMLQIGYWKTYKMLENMQQQHELQQETEEDKVEP